MSLFNCLLYQTLNFYNRHLFCVFVAMFCRGFIIYNSSKLNYNSIFQGILNNYIIKNKKEVHQNNVNCFIMKQLNSLLLYYTLIFYIKNKMGTHGRKKNAPSRARAWNILRFFNTYNVKKKKDL